MCGVFQGTSTFPVFHIFPFKRSVLFLLYTLSEWAENNYLIRGIRPNYSKYYYAEYRIHSLDYSSSANFLSFLLWTHDEEEKASERINSSLC